MKIYLILTILKQLKKPLICQVKCFTYAIKNHAAVHRFLVYNCPVYASMIRFLGYSRKDVKICSVCLAVWVKIGQTELFIVQAHLKNKKENERIITRKRYDAIGK